jgi:hypothetical protein
MNILPLGWRTPGILDTPLDHDPTQPAIYTADDGLDTVTIQSRPFNPWPWIIAGTAILLLTQSRRRRT